MESTCRTSARALLDQAEERANKLSAILDHIRNAEPEPEPNAWGDMTEAEADAVIDRCDEQMRRAHEAGLFPYLMALWDTLPQERQDEINAMLK